MEMKDVYNVFVRLMYDVIYQLKDMSWMLMNDVLVRLMYSVIYQHADWPGIMIFN